MEIDNFWGKYTGEKYPQVRFDPLLSFLSQNEIFGYRIHIVPGRGSRPRDNKMRRPVKRESKDPSESIFFKVSHGTELSIPISTEQELVSKYSDDPEFHNLTEALAVSILNKYAPLNNMGENAAGVSLVTYSNIYSEHLGNTEANFSILQSLKIAISAIINKKFQSSLIFFNIGPTSGASLRQLHAQTYIIPHNSGMLSANFQHAYESASQKLGECLVCKIANEENCIDHVGQNLETSGRIVWEDANWRVMVPYAPIRALAIRIIPKTHKNWFGKLNEIEIRSLAGILKMADNLINIATPSKWPALIDRTIVFRQGITIEQDFHFFIDVLPSIPFGGSELVDSLSITSLDPDKSAEIMRNYLSNKS
ncbi:MAG: hypothetical protein GPJ54_17995 [Candidatus Heimdallarchaeota archaeon]|nr:hypothetical protein [Candidatus Heimdallarchaeota archaeon]